MKKISLLALAVPALFAACQDELVTDTRNPQSEGLMGEVAGKVDFVLDQTSLTRVAWGDTQKDPSWTNTDKFSLFWVGPKDSEYKDGGVYQGASNAVYHVEQGATTKFTTPSVIYVGSHVLVSPADLTHVGKDNITVSVGAVQDEGKAIGDRTILVGDTVLNVQKAPAEEKDKKAGVVYAGYDEPVNMPVSALSSNVHFNLKFANFQNDVEVEKVMLIAEDTIGNAIAPFVTEANLAANANGHVSAVPTAMGKTNTLTVKFPAGTIVPQDGSLPVHFSMLPSVVNELATWGKDKAGVKDSVHAYSTVYKIVVCTSYGDVTIDNASQVYRESQGVKTYQSDSEIAKDAKLEDIEKLPLGFFAAFYDNAVRDIDNPETKDVNEAEATYGNHTVRTVAVDMSTANINGKVIETSDDIVKYYGVYHKLGKTATKAPATFILQPATSTFVMSKAAADLLLDANYNITLANENVTAIVLEKEITAVPAFTTIKKDEANALTNIDLVLSAGGTWALNVKDAANFNAWKSITNKGTLTVSSAAVTPAGADLNKALTNEAAATFNAVTFPVAYTQSADAATTTIAADVTFGTINIDKGELTVGEGFEVYFGKGSSAGTITNNGTLKAADVFENNGKFINNYRLNVADGGQFINNDTLSVPAGSLLTYITSNENGIVILGDRKEELTIDGNKGIVEYTATDADIKSGKFGKLTGDKFNKLVMPIAGVDLTNMDYANTKTLVLAVNPASTTFTMADNDTIDNLIVGVEGNTTRCVIAIAGTGVQVNNLTIRPKTTMHITTAGTMTYNGTSIDNEGTLLVGGTFTASNMVDPSGTSEGMKYEEAGGNIVWK